MRKVLLIMAAVLSACAGWAQDGSYVITDGNEGYAGTSSGWWRDESGTADLAQAMQAMYTPGTSDVLNFQRDNAAYWIRVPVKNESTNTLFFIQIDFPQIDSIAFYSEADGQWKRYLTGDRFAYKARIVDHPTFLFPFVLEQGESCVMYLRVRSRDQLFLPLRIGDRRSIDAANNDKGTFFGLYFGVIFSLFFYNLFIYFTTGDKSYFWYILYVASIGLTQAALEGYLFKYLTFDFPGFHNFSIVLFSALTGLTAIEFAKDFVRPKEFTPRFYRGLIVFQTLYIAAVAVYLMGWISLSFIMVDIGALTVSIYALIFISIIASKGYRPAKFFLIAWTVFLAGIFVFALRNFNVLPYNFFTNSVIQLGSGLEVILLSMALADRINILKREKEESQAEALRVSMENERIVREQNELLERKVKERTKQLESANRELEDALLTLKEAQSQLVDAEKMASLGQLTAGIAHEINNPINFISANIGPLKRDMEDIRTLLEWLEKKLREGSDLKTIEELDKFKSDIEFDYVIDEVDGLLKGMEDGTERTVEIIKGLKVFSRVDEQDIKFVDLHEGLDSTLILLNSSIKDRIRIKRSYGQLPKVECYPGKLNQVFMNIINNAAQAIKADQKETDKGTITIKTSTYGDDHVRIDFEDDGPGMSEEVKNKIFEPFFTTKPVGEGTGLGLSIVYNIVKNHGGTIEVESNKGKGTNFSIILPIYHMENQ